MKFLQFSALAAAALLSACGGGGGGAPPAPTVTLTVAPTTITAGQSVTLSWTSNATSCVASGSWTGSGPPSGTYALVLSNAGTYTFIMTCSAGGAAGSASATVTVNYGGASQIPVTLTADPTVVAVGASTTLSWSAQDAASCTATGAWSGTKTTVGSQSVTVPAAGYNTFGLNCTGPAGSGSQQVYVQGLQATLTFSAAPPSVGAGKSTVLTWSTSQASTCAASGAWSGVKAASGSEEVLAPALGANTYSLTCSDPGAAVTKAVTVTGLAPDVTLRAFPPSPQVGESVTLHWEDKYATSCAASQGWSGAQATKGRKTFAVTAAGTTEYAITCSNNGGSDAASISVAATAPPALPPATGYQLSHRHDGFVSFSGGITLPLTATPAWSQDLGAPVSYAMIADGLVFVVSQNTDGSYGNRLFALNQATGATVWGPKALPGVYFWNGLAYDDGRVFTLNFDGLLRAFNAANGVALWTKAMPGYWHDAEPVAYGGIVVATGNYGTVAFAQATGEQLWTRGLYGERASPALTSEGLYMIANRKAVSLNPFTGEDQWTASIGDYYGADIAVRNGIAYARYIDGNIFMADAATGEDAGSLSSQRAVAVTDALVISLYSGSLMATSVADGTQQWTFAGDGNLVSPPIVVNDTVFAGSSSGKVYALNAATGAQLWFGTTAALEVPDQWNGGLLPGLSAGEGWLIATGANTVAGWRLK